MSAARPIVIALILVIYTFWIGLLGLFLTLLIGWQGSGSRFGDALRETFDAAFESHSIGYVWLPATAMAATQFCFVLPLFSRRFAPTRHGRSFKASVVAAAMVAAILFVGLIAAVSELMYWLRTGRTDVGDVLFEAGLNDVVSVDRWAWWPYVMASWLLWMPLLWLFCKRMPPARAHSQLARWLLAGTIVEVIVVLPLDVMVRRKSQCYCNTGTFFALCMSVFALLWLTGPGIVLALTSKRRRLWSETMCMNCGYEKGPQPPERCPECGREWRETAR